ncbi:MAG: type III pantothenate kinase [Acidobacteriota bacterium]
MKDGLLVVDLGNSHLVAGVYDGEELIASWRLPTPRNQTVDEVRLRVDSLLRLDGIDREGLSAVIVASVVPPVTKVLCTGLRRLLGLEPLVVAPGIKTGMRLLYDHPEEIGADRIVNSIAAHAEVDGPVVAVDFGTATTFDCVAANGDYLGGVIAPGLGISAEALFSSASRLPRVEIRRPERVIGKTTIQAMQAGIFHGYVGLVDGILDKVLEEMPEGCRVIATGGLAHRVAEASHHVAKVMPELTLLGLRLLHERNR